MKTNELTAAQLKELLVYEPTTGVFTRAVTKNWRWKAGSVAGTTRKTGSKVGYITINLEGRLYLAHRLAWLYVYGVWPDSGLDHIDGNAGNNRIANLRKVSQLVNTQNYRQAPRGKTHSPLFGAHWCKQINKWKSSIRVNKRVVYLGVFATDVEASAAYLSAKRRLHEGCTI